MNILILSWRGPGHPHEGGAEQSTQEHAKAWVKAGHKVVLFTSYYKGAQREEVVDGVLVIRYGWQFLGVQIAAFCWFLIGKHSKFDLVVDQFHGIPFFTPFYVKAKRLSFIHETTKEVWFLYPWPKPLNILAGLLGYLIEPLIFKVIYKKTRFMTVSESTKSDLIRWGISEKNITVVHNGVTLDLPKKSMKKEQRKTAIYLGALAKDKGIEDAFEVFRIISESQRDWQFWIVGKGEAKYIEMLRSKLKQDDFNPRVKFWGFVTDSRKFELLARSYVLVNPSVREGWGLVNIEANSVGTPVVGYNVQGMKDSVQNNKTGILVNIRDTRTLAENVIKLTGDRSLYLKFRKNCLLWSKKFSWEKAQKESLKLIENL